LGVGNFKMFILDSLFMSGFRWVLNTVVSAAEAEMNDDAALRDQLLAAEMRRETGEISDDEFAAIEADLLARIREIKTRREGGSGPIAFGGPLETSEDTQFAIEATVSGDFHEPSSDPVPFAAEPITAGDRSGTVIEGSLFEPRRPARTARSTGPRRRAPARPKRRSSRKIR
jgi:Gas vesicle protein G